MANEHEAEPVRIEPLAYVAAIDEEQLELASRPRSANGERSRLEAPHEPTTHSEVDDYPDP